MLVAGGRRHRLQRDRAHNTRRLPIQRIDEQRNSLSWPDPCNKKLVDVGRLYLELREVANSRHDGPGKDGVPDVDRNASDGAPERRGENFGPRGASDARDLLLFADRVADSGRDACDHPPTYRADTRLGHGPDLASRLRSRRGCWGCDPRLRRRNRTALHDETGDRQHDDGKSNPDDPASSSAPDRVSNRSAGVETAG
jgi:hypothetical protein